MHFWGDGHQEYPAEPGAAVTQPYTSGRKWIEWINGLTLQESYILRPDVLEANNTGMQFFSGAGTLIILDLIWMSFIRMGLTR